MKNIFAVLAILIGTTLGIQGFADDTQLVHATLATKEVSFFHQGIHSFYSCDYVQNETEKALSALGARDAKVRCAGGLPYESYTHVTASFKAIRETSADKSTMTAKMTSIILRHSDSCDLHEEILRNLLPAFEVYSKRVHSSCWDSQGDVEYDVTVLR